MAFCERATPVGDVNRAPLAAAVLAVVVVAPAVAAGGVGVAASQDASAEVVARYPTGNGSMVEETVIGPADVASVDAPQKPSRGPGWQVPMELTEAGAEEFSATLTDAGFTSDGVQSCPANGERNEDGYCLLTVVDGEVTNALAVSEGFAEIVESGEFAEDPRFVLSVVDEATATEVARAFGWQANETTTAVFATSDSTTGEPATSADTATTDSGEASGSAPGFGVAATAAAVALGAAGWLSRR